MLHELKVSPKTIHWGHYDASLEPVLNVDPGDTIKINTMGLPKGHGTDFTPFGLTQDEIPLEFIRALETETSRGPGAHTLTGPIFVKSAKPQDVLEVEMVDIKPLLAFGYTAFRPESGTIPYRFPYAKTKIIRFDSKKITAELPGGARASLKPFFGSIGVAPLPTSGRINSGPPGVHRGNMDNKELIQGSKIYLPVHAEGALLSLGDGHALQGDGEVSGTAIETSLTGTIRLYLRKDMRLKWPMAETPTHIITMGFHRDLYKATKMAIHNTIDYLTEHQGMAEDDAYMLSSIAVDFHITQTVNGVKGIHGLLEKTIIGQTFKT
jgi:acetamidase/formamidase